MTMDDMTVVRSTPTLRELALDKMRGAILSLHFKAGERLVERKLCEQLGVSRTIIREVLRHLEAEGLVTMQPHQGPVVAEIDGALESMVARALAQRPDRTEATRELNQAIDTIETAFKSGELSRALGGTAQFYEVLFTQSGMDVAWSIIRNLNARINSLRALTLSAHGRTKTGPEDMREIVRAIAKGDSEAAERACKQHVHHAHEILKQRLKELASEQARSADAAG
jgi:GntR family transcriptional regulator, trigonelline degradation regulator